MAIHKHNSWGRTRSPKNIAGPPGAEVTPLADTDDLIGITADIVGGVGYATENQRYLHVLIEDEHGSGAAPTATTIFGYCHAFAKWFEICENNEFSSNTAASAASIAVADSNRVNADAQVPSDREYRIYVIAGIDRVAFVNANGARVNIYAACSTF